MIQRRRLRLRLMQSVLLDEVKGLGRR